MGVSGIGQVVGGSSSSDILVGQGQDNAGPCPGQCGYPERGHRLLGFETLVGQDDHDDAFTILASGRIDAPSWAAWPRPPGLDSIRFDAGGSSASVSYYVSGVDSGAVVRDADALNYSGIEWVADESAAATRNFDYVARQDHCRDLHPACFPKGRSGASW
jgi:hypothetical protein